MNGPEKHPPSDVNALLKSVHDGARYTHIDQEIKMSGKTVLGYGEERELQYLVELIRSGHAAVIIVNTQDDKLRYMISCATRAQGVVFMATVIKSTSEGAA